MTLLTPEELNQIPAKGQTQASLADQLRTLQQVANHLGLYDAADFLSRTHEKATERSADMAFALEPFANLYDEFMAEDDKLPDKVRVKATVTLNGEPVHYVNWGASTFKGASDALKKGK